MAAYCDMALLFFIKEPPLPEVKHRASGFFIPEVFGISEPFKIAMEPCNYLKSYVSRPRLSDYRCNSAEPCKIHF